MLTQIRDVLISVVMVGLLGLTVYDHFDRGRPVPPPAPTAVNGQALGHTFAPALVASYAAAWTAAAEAIESGKSIAEAQAALQSAWQSGRSQAFATQVAPHFALVLPEGTEPIDPAKRAAVAELWRDFAKGLTQKGGRW